MRQCSAPFFDESSSSDDGANYYVIAGYVGRLEDWAEFHAKWTAALRAAHVESFHATDCEGGYKQFKHLRGSEHNDERRDIQMRFAKAVQALGLVGVSASISLRHHNYFEPNLPAAKGQAHMSVPHMLAFRAFVQFVARTVEDVAPSEVVDFVASDGPYSGRMRDLYEQLKRHVALSWVNRVGTFSVARARDVPALQAADQLAYETWRMRENRGTSRPHMKVIRQGGQVKEYLLNKRFYQRLDANTKRLLNEAPLGE